MLLSSLHAYQPPFLQQLSAARTYALHEQQSSQRCSCLTRSCQGKLLKGDSDWQPLCTFQCWPYSSIANGVFVQVQNTTRITLFLPVPLPLSPHPLPRGPLQATLSHWYLWVPQGLSPSRLVGAHSLLASSQLYFFSFPPFFGSSSSCFHSDMSMFCRLSNPCDKAQCSPWAAVGDPRHSSSPWSACVLSW